MVNHPNRSKRTLEKLVRAYAEWIKTECAGEDEPAAPLIVLAAQADTFTAPYLAALLLLDNERNADPPYRQSGEFFDERLEEIASKIQWVAP